MADESGKKSGVTRRQVIGTGAAGIALGASGKALALTYTHQPDWVPFSHSAPPIANDSEGWQFFTSDEGAAIEAIVARLIPSDDLSISGKDAGCAIFIDRQMMGSFGDFSHYYMEGPFQEGTPSQGDQSSLVPQQRYRLGLAQLDKYCQSKHQRSFAQLNDSQQDEILHSLEQGDIPFDHIPSDKFFALVLQNTMEGFFADPIYGGNKNMVSWRMIGFPGARYDYRQYVNKHNQTIDLEPLSIAGGSHWNTEG